MNIFHAIAPDDEVRTLQEALGALVERASEEDLILDGDFRSQPWSLVQLRASEEDFDWLVEWAAALVAEMVQRVMEEDEWWAEDDKEPDRLEEDRRGRVVVD